MARKALIALITAYAMPAFAQDRVAIVVSSDSGAEPTESMRKDAFALSETLFGMGFAVTRMENPQAADLTAALERVPDEATALLFFSGVARPEVADVLLVTGTTPLPLSGALTALGTKGQALVFLDTCRAGAEVLPQPAVSPGVFLALPVAPGASCAEGAPSMAQEMLARITVPGIPVTEQFAGNDAGPWVASTLAEPFIFRAASSETVLTAADYRMLESLSAEDRDKMISLWAEAGIAVDVAGARPAAATVAVVGGASPVIAQDAGIISPVQAVASPIVSGAVVEGEALAVLAAAPAAPRSTGPRPVPGAGGLPQPSIILGETETLASLAVPEEPVEEEGALAPGWLYDNPIEVRNATRETDAAAYAEFVSLGAYDPPPEQLAFAVQTELARMNCYTRTIDGDWGNGSRRALQLYYDTLEVAATTQEPTLEVYRQILTEDPVECPDVVAPAPAPAAATPRTTQRTTRQPAAAAPQAAAPAPAPAPAPAETGRRIRTGTGTGAFR